MLPETENRVVFGVRPCDGRGPPRMDRVFAEPPDAYYQARREGLAYVGLACNHPPSPYCFCKSVGGSPVSSDGLDVLLTDLGEHYLAAAATETGEELMRLAGMEGAHDARRPPRSRRAGCFVEVCRSIAGGDET